MATSMRDKLFNGATGALSSIQSSLTKALRAKQSEKSGEDSPKENDPEGKASEIENKDREAKEKLFVRQLADTPHAYRWKPRIFKSSENTKENKFSATDFIAESKTNRKVRLAVLGCQGNLAHPENQRRVAELIAAMPVKPDIIIFVGDNFYDSGVDHWNADVFDKNFEAIYQICGVPCLILGGNHDYNIWSQGKTYGTFDRDQILPQVQRTYMDPKDKKLNPERVDLFKEQELDITKLPLWNFESRFRVHRPNDGVELFLLDSNTFAQDFIKACNEEKDNPNNQVNWLVAEVKKNPNAIKLLFLHHPLFTIGKRALSPDGYQYLTQEEIGKLEKLGINVKDQNGKVKSLNEILRLIFEKLGLLKTFNAIFPAHDHFMYYHLDTESGLCEAVVGGGGGDLQDPVVFKAPHKTPYFEKNFGFAEVEIDPDDKSKNKVLITFHNVDKHSFVFNTQEAEAQREYLGENPKKLQNIVVKACDEILKTFESIAYSNLHMPYALVQQGYEIIKGLTYSIWVPKQALRVGEIRNYFNRHKALNVVDALNFLETEIKQHKLEALREQIKQECQSAKAGVFDEFAAKLRKEHSAPQSIPKDSDVIKSPEHRPKSDEFDDDMVHVTLMHTPGAGNVQSPASYTPGQFKPKSPKLRFTLVDDHFDANDETNASNGGMNTVLQDAHKPKSPTATA